MFKYSSILAYMFIYFQADRFNFSMQKMDTDGRPQPITAWTSLLKHNSVEYDFKAFIDQFYQTLTSSTYAQFQKQSSTAQHRLLSAFDTEKGRMHMAYLQEQVSDPKVILDYKRDTFEFQAKDMHPTDQMDLHKHTGEMVFHTLAHALASASKF
jgi:hypothetical protein